MTTDITELAQREKFEAWLEGAEALPWGYLKKRRSSDDTYQEQNTTDMWGAWKAASTELVETLEKAQAINAAAEKLVRCKGRYHSEQNYRALAALFGVNTPDLPPLDGESRTVTVKLPEPVGVIGTDHWIGEMNMRSAVIQELKSTGIKWEAD